MSIVQDILFLIIALAMVGFMAIADHYHVKYKALRRQLDNLIQKDGFAYRKHFAQPTNFTEL